MTHKLFLCLLFFSSQAFAVDIVSLPHFDIQSLKETKIVRETSELSGLIKVAGYGTGIHPYALTAIVRMTDLALKDSQELNKVYITYRLPFNEVQIASGIKDGAKIRVVRPSTAIFQFSDDEISNIRYLSRQLRDSPMKEIIEAMRWIGRNGK